MWNKGLIISFVSLIACGPALAQEQWSSSVGLRGWYQTWKGNGPGLSITDRSTNVLTHLDNDPTLAIIPFASVRSEKWGVAGSTMLRKNYHGTDGAFVLDQNRREYDINALYYFLPSASVSVGYKNFQWGDTLGGQTTIDGPTVALSASAPLSDSLGLYSTIGYGALRGKSTNLPRKSTSYVLLDAGFSYSFGGVVGKNLALTAGYRYQQLVIKQLTVNRDFWDQTSGFTVGVVATF